MSEHKKALFGSIAGAFLTLCGCGTAPSKPSDAGEPTLVEEIAVVGFDSDGEPVIKTWSDGTMWIHFETMPPFFAEDNGTESEFENFEEQLQEALGVAVSREDREVFVIQNPQPDTAEKAKTWLQAFPKNGE